MRKGYNGTQTITVLSNLGASGSSYTLSLPGTGYTAGQKITEIYTCTNLTVNSNGSVPVPMKSGLPRILYPADKLVNGSSFCSSAITVFKDAGGGVLFFSYTVVFAQVLIAIMT
ncbi:hypothetical protein CBS147482_7775 [Aspergillus niger]|nr:hypothetical protein CBS147482_7775 [Aspergillus niger]